MNPVVDYPPSKHWCRGKCIKLLSVSLALAFALSACGQRSDLVLPTEDEQEQAQSSQ